MYEESFKSDAHSIVQHTDGAHGKEKKNAANNSVAYKLWPWFFPGLSVFFFPRPKKEDLRH